MKISSKIFGIVLLTVMIVSAINYAFFVFGINPAAKTETIRIQEELVKSERLFQEILMENTRALTTALTVFTYDESFKSVYFNGSREKLQEKSLPLFDELKAKYNLTHFYFIQPNSTAFLRVHKPEKYGDTIDRLTFKQAQEKKALSSGIEFGPLMFFTLRVVAPYYQNGEIIGYVEFGKEMDDILANFKKTEGDDIILLVDKQYIDQQKWSETRAERGVRDSWNDIADYVIVASTMTRERGSEELSGEHIKTHAKTCFSSELLNEVKEGVVVLGQFEEDAGGTFICGGTPLRDAENKIIGVTVTHHDISAIALVSKQTNNVLFLTTMILGLIVVMITFIIISILVSKPLTQLTRTIEQLSRGNINAEINPKLKESKDEIGELARAFERTMVSLKLAMKKSGIKTQVPEEKEVTVEDLSKSGFIKK